MPSDGASWMFREQSGPLNSINEHPGSYLAEYVGQETTPCTVDPGLKFGPRQVHVGRVFVGIETYSIFKHSSISSLRLTCPGNKYFLDFPR